MIRFVWEEKKIFWVCLFVCVCDAELRVVQVVLLVLELHAVFVC